MADLGQLFNEFGAGFAGLTPQLMMWLGRLLIAVLIMGGLWAIYTFFILYKYKVTIFERGGSGKEDNSTSHFIRKIRTDFAKETKDKTGISNWQLLFARKKLEPISLKHIYPGNKVFLYKVAPDCFVPTDFRCTTSESTFNPIPQSVRRWMSLEIQQAAQDYQVQSAWDKYGNLLIMGSTILFCLILVGITVYLTYEHANQVVPALADVTSAVRNRNVIPGI